MKLSHWITFSTLLVSGIILWSLKEVLIHLFAAIIIAVAVCSLVERIRSIKKMPRGLALTICLSVLITLFSLFFIIVVPPFAEEFQQILIQLPIAAKALWEITISSIDNISGIVYGDNSEGLWEQKIFGNGFNPLSAGGSLATGVGDGIKKIIGLASNLGIGLVQILFIIAVSLMVTLQPKSYIEVSVLLVPSFYRIRAREILNECGNALSSWMVGVIISSIFVSLLAGIGLSLLGVKLVIANALLAGILNIIPNVGPVLSTIFPISVALLDAPWKALAVIGMYVFIQNIESYLITPSVMHHQVKLLPGLTLTAQFVFTIIFGPIGLILALPLAVVIQVLIREIIIHDMLDKWDDKQKLLT